MAFVTVSDTTPTQRQRQYQLGGNFIESQRPIPVERPPQVAAEVGVRVLETPPDLTKSRTFTLTLTLKM